MRLWVFGCFINNGGEHLSTGKCGRSKTDITALPAFANTRASGVVLEIIISE